ncbi:MAG: hypothetical protein ACI95C_000323 [Pseudohongiellaceae bacterium]|jgi:hypothetical protein
MPAFGSDHLAFYTELVLSDDSCESRGQLSPDKTDHKLAKEKIAQEDVTSQDVPFSKS